MIQNQNSDGIVLTKTVAVFLCVMGHIKERRLHISNMKKNESYCFLQSES